MAKEDFERRIVSELAEIKEVVKELKTLNKNIEKIAQNIEVLVGKHLQKKYTEKD